MKILLWISAIILWLAIALLLGAYAWDVWKDVRRVLSFARAYDRSLRKAEQSSIWTVDGGPRALWVEFKDLRRGIETVITFHDGSKWSSEAFR